MSPSSRWAGHSRLQAVAESIPHGTRVAEIGTDHGILPRRLLASGRAAYCIATDLNVASIEGLRRLLDRYPRRERLDLRAGDGLSVLRAEDRIDVVVVAGLGSARIRRILEAPQTSSLGIRRLVLQPQNDPASLRRWLAEHGWSIVDERMALERGRFYVVIAAEPASGRPDRRPEPGNEILLEAGPCLIRSTDPLVRRFWEDRLELYESALEGARCESSRARLALRRDVATKVLRMLPRRSRAASGRGDGIVPD